MARHSLRGMGRSSQAGCLVFVATGLLVVFVIATNVKASTHVWGVKSPIEVSSIYITHTVIPEWAVKYKKGLVWHWEVEKGKWWHYRGTKEEYLKFRYSKKRQRRFCYT